MTVACCNLFLWTEKKKMCFLVENFECKQISQLLDSQYLHDLVMTFLSLLVAFASLALRASKSLLFGETGSGLSTSGSTVFSADIIGGGGVGGRSAGGITDADALCSGSAWTGSCLKSVSSLPKRLKGNGCYPKKNIVF